MVTRSVVGVVLLLVVAAAAALGFWWHSNRNSSGGVSTPTRHTPALPSDNAKSADIPNGGSKPMMGSGPVWFAQVTDETGIDFVHRSGNSPEKPFPSANGSGIAVLDYDRDGWEDLYFATGTDFPLDPDRTEPYNRLYRSVGPWRFHHVTQAAAVAHAGFSAGVAVGDFDNDGFPDVYVTCYGRNCLFHNLGDGTFERIEQQAGVDDKRWGASAAWLDGNNDGWLDLYVCNYAKWTLETHQYCGDRTRNIRVHCSPTSVEPEDDVYYVNQQDGTFRDATQEAGLRVAPGRGQGVVAADLNQDGWIDIYVANDLNANMLFFNRGDGTFDDESERSGTAHDWRGTNQAGMGVEAGDYNSDGRIDLIVTNYSDEHNVVYENLDGRFFRDNSRAANLVAGSLKWIGWGVALVDFDTDGAADLLVTNGHVDDNRHLLGQDAPYRQPPLLWKGNRRRFELLDSPGDYFQGRHVGRALVVFDPNHDGVPDVVIGHQDEPPALLENRIGKADRVALVTLRGLSHNRDAIGATLLVHTAHGLQAKPVKSGASYLSSSTLTQFVTFASDEPEYLVEVRWPGGAVSRIETVRPMFHYEVYEPAGSIPMRVVTRRLSLQTETRADQRRQDVTE
ncbi:MAG: hypothetical protein KatS3mg110_4664 [Pirellulaceae bacterium]|nr:MAG: hypothetical protein KatS3mg110_4664 [Pirellulaceae bacterium]